VVMMEFDKFGKRIATDSQLTLLIPKKRGRGRPRKHPLDESVENTTKTTKFNTVKTKLRLLETIVNSYKKIERIEEENNENIKEFNSLVGNLD